MRAATHVLWLFVLSVALGACAPGEEGAGDNDTTNNDEAATAEEAEGAQASLLNTDGDEVGNVTFVEEDNLVNVEATVTAPDLANDFHGFHVHEVGTCEADAPDGPFTTAEGHLQPDGEAHGAHAGDMPPLYVTEEGEATLEFATDRLELADLTTGDGTAVIVHADRDNLGHIPERYESGDSGEPGPDEETQDTGDAGDRALCGVVEPA